MQDLGDTIAKFPPSKNNNVYSIVMNWRPHCLCFLNLYDFIMYKNVLYRIGKIWKNLHFVIISLYIKKPVILLNLNVHLVKKKVYNFMIIIMMNYGKIFHLTLSNNNLIIKDIL